MAETTLVLDGALLGDDDEAELSAWLVSAGTTVVAGQPIAEISGAKATVEVAAPAAGRLRQLVDVGAVLTAGEPFAVIEEA